MSNNKRWVQRGGGSFFKWDEEGKSLEGKWKGQHDGKFGPLGNIETAEGKVTFPLHTALLYLVDGLTDGDEVKIVFTGREVNPKSGREFKTFDVFVAQDGEAVDAKSDDDIPF